MTRHAFKTISGLHNYYLLERFSHDLEMVREPKQQTNIKESNLIGLANGTLNARCFWLVNAYAS